MSLVFSYTIIDCFHEVCPRQVHARWIRKVPQPETEALREGKRAHAELEARMMKKHSLEFGLHKMEAICAAVEKRGTVKTELKMGVNRDLQPASFFSNGVYIRSVLDVLVTNGSGAVNVDWKTGKNREGDKTPLQLMLGAAQTFTAYPEVQNVLAFNAYTKTGGTGTVHSWNRSELPEIWRTVLPLIHEIEQAEFDNNWPERPGPLCGWCPDFSCSHNKNPDKPNA